VLVAEKLENSDHWKKIAENLNNQKLLLYKILTLAVTRDWLKPNHMVGNW
jgi:hypothetical protein